MVAIYRPLELRLLCVRQGIRLVCQNQEDEKPIFTGCLLEQRIFYPPNRRTHSVPIIVPKAIKAQFLLLILLFYMVGPLGFEPRTKGL